MTAKQTPWMRPCLHITTGVWSPLESIVLAH